MRSTFKILFYLKKNSLKSDGKAPLMARITINGTISQFGCKINILPDLWDHKTGKMTGKSETACKTNSLLENMRIDITKRYREIMQSHGFVTAERVKSAYLGLDRQQDSILSLFARHIREFSLKIGYTRSESTYQKYRILYNHLERYIVQEYKRRDIFPAELDLTFLNGFEYYLRKERNCSTNTIWVYMTALKHIVSKAIYSGQLSFNPFSGYSISPESKDRGFLSKEDMISIVHTKMQNSKQELVRDLFVFSCFTGLGYADVKNLTEYNVRKAFDDHLWVITRRRKTNTDSSIRLLEVPKRIIEKYRGHCDDSRLFPIPSNSSCNATLKDIAKQCGIRTRLTYHVARHTFATLLTLSQGVPIETVSKMLGHADIKTTQIYARITKDKISRDMDILSQRLKTVEKQIISVL